ncbi:hypothetical protein M0R45_030860 [Rubus argutus]|uniref:Uncharacterized protein n=1 Tax=Rubus argutus TaxID=59490 RepID=A0AAW1WGK7_RUBAR
MPRVETPAQRRFGGCAASVCLEEIAVGMAGLRNGHGGLGSCRFGSPVKQRGAAAARTDLDWVAGRRRRGRGGEAARRQLCERWLDWRTTP